ncbi:MCE family protein [Nocardioides sp.]|uniref:MCE family protein n=1 Tax=Nocardioides sp. TaxID=35761 RepID=UPI001A2063B0|nr:MCE family protein [Nocardioides sp.]MBJ7356837.1 MCE family protein [Nocardioides sp.]
MTRLAQLLNVRTVALAVAVLLLLGTFVLVGRDEPSKTVTAHFPRAVSVYVGTDVRILGVNVGKVTAVIPEGNSVRVEMEYDATYDVPADAKAAIVTPTLVADRFVQLTPAFEEGDKVMASGADIPLPDTGVPVELDRIYASLEDLTIALGPNGVNKDGTLDHTLAAAREAFEGNGARGNQMIRNLSEAAVTFGEGSGDLFETVSSLARFTEVLATNDAVVRAFMKDLAEVSAALADEREELSAALASVADAVGTVESFVRDNRKALVTDVEKLTRTLKTINSEKESIDTALTVAPVAMGNLILAFDAQSSSVGSRIGVQQNIADLDGFLCSVVQQSGMPQVSKDLACTLFEQIIESGVPSKAAVRKAAREARAAADTPAGQQRARTSQVQDTPATDSEATVTDLFGGSS